MKIDATNTHLLNSTNGVSFHDDILDQLSFDRSSSILSLLIREDDEVGTSCTVNFFNTVGFEMTCCDFWGHSPHILDFESVVPSEQILLPKLENMSHNNTPVMVNKMNRGKAYIEVLLTFSSGDTLRIACEYIHIMSI